MDNSRVKELETQLLETRMLYTTSIEDYNVVSSYSHCLQCVVLHTVTYVKCFSASSDS